MRSPGILATLGVSLLLAGCVSGGGTRIDNVPMYGQPEVERPESLRKADDDFIRQAASRFGSRQKASTAWWSQGEKHMNEGNLDHAMRRYNQSWLLDPENYQPYWGFARVLMEQDKVDDAIGYLEKAESLIDDPYQQVALLADLGSAYSYKGIESPGYFAKANEKFSQSVALDPDYPGSWRRWAFSLYEQGDYGGAWEKVRKAESLSARPFPPRFISELEARLPRPQ